MKHKNLPIYIRIEAKGTQLSSVILSKADAFSYEILGADGAFEKALIHWLDLYCRKIPSPFAIPLEQFTSFQQKVLTQLSQIPFGTTLSYGELGKRCGQKLAGRAVGGACKRNPFPLFIPCHRVIQGNGSIGGFALDLEIKQRLLAFEGKIFKELRS